MKPIQLVESFETTNKKAVEEIKRRLRFKKNFDTMINILKNMTQEENDLRSS